MNFVALQIQEKSVDGQPAEPKLVRAQERAHCGMSVMLCRGMRAAFATAMEAVRAMTTFILIDCWMKNKI